MVALYLRLCLYLLLAAQTVCASESFIELEPPVPAHDSLCGGFFLSWTGGLAPYEVHILRDNGGLLVDDIVGTDIQSINYTWTPHPEIYPDGTVFNVLIHDSMSHEQSTTGNLHKVTPQTSCPPSASPVSSSGASASQSSLDTSSIPSYTPSAEPSSTTESADTSSSMLSSPSPSPSFTGITSPRSINSVARSSIIVGAVFGVLLFFSAIIGWYRWRSARRRKATSSTGSATDSSTYTPSSTAQRTSSPLPQWNIHSQSDLEAQLPLEEKDVLPSLATSELTRSRRQYPSAARGHSVFTQDSGTPGETVLRWRSEDNTPISEKDRAALSPTIPSAYSSSPSHAASSTLPISHARAGANNATASSSSEPVSTLAKPQASPDETNVLMPLHEYMRLVGQRRSRVNGGSAEGTAAPPPYQI